MVHLPVTVFVGVTEGQQLSPQLGAGTVTVSKYMHCTTKQVEVSKPAQGGVIEVVDVEQEWGIFVVSVCVVTNVVVYVAKVAPQVFWWSASGRAAVGWYKSKSIRCRVF